MFKVAVLSLLVLGCSALPYQSYGSYGSQSILTSQPKISVVGLNSGYGGYGLRSGYSGLSSGFSGLGYGLNSGYSLGSRYGLGLNSGALLAAAPIATTQYVAAAPAVATIAAAPIATTQLISAAPAVQSYGLNQNINLLTARQGQQFQQVVPAAIQQIARTVEYRALPNVEQPIQAQVVEVEPSDNPVHLHFKTRSSTLSASQSHIAAQAPEVQTAAAQDEPQRLITEVQKPVIQEVKEVISPFRQVTQEINPVVESLHTIVTKGEGQRQQYVAQQQYAAPALQASYQTVQAAPALQTVAVQAAPAIQVQAAPVAVETVAVQAPALQTVAVQAPAALQTSYQTIQAAQPIAVSTPLSSYTYSNAAPSSSFSTFNLGSSSLGLNKIQKPLLSGSGSFSSFSSSSSGY